MKKLLVWSLFVVLFTSYAVAQDANAERKQRIAQAGFTDLDLPSGTCWTNTEAYQKEWSSADAPTVEQWKELYYSCKWRWDGQGYRVTGANGNSIYLFAEGYVPEGKTSHYKVAGGYYWTAVYGEFISFDERGVYIQHRTTSVRDRLSTCRARKF